MIKLSNHGSNISMNFKNWWLHLKLDISAWNPMLVSAHECHMLEEDAWGQDTLWIPNCLLLISLSFGFFASFILSLLLISPSRLKSLCVDGWLNEDKTCSQLECLFHLHVAIKMVDMVLQDKKIYTLPGARECKFHYYLKSVAVDITISQKKSFLEFCCYRNISWCFQRCLY